MCCNCVLQRFRIAKSAEKYSENLESKSLSLKDTESKLSEFFLPKRGTSEIPKYRKTQMSSDIANLLKQKQGPKISISEEKQHLIMKEQYKVENERKSKPFHWCPTSPRRAGGG